MNLSSVDLNLLVALPRVLRALQSEAPNRRQGEPHLDSRRHLLKAAGAVGMLPFVPPCPRPGSSKLAVSTRGMVTSPHELATEAWLNVSAHGNTLHAPKLL